MARADQAVNPALTSKEDEGTAEPSKVEADHDDKSNSNDKPKPKKFSYFDSTLVTRWNCIDRKRQAGPSTVLRDWMLGEKRVIVCIRSLNRVRSYARGFLVAFDFHWNLVLKDVDEFMLDGNVRKAARETMKKNTFGRTDICVFRKGQMDKQDVEIDVEKDSCQENDRSFALNATKHSLIQRFVKQIFVRGDNVVSIRMADVPKVEETVEG